LQLKRQWAQGKNDMEKAAQEVLRLQKVFEVAHPEYAQLADYVLTGLFMCMEGWDGFAKHAWGRLPKNTLDWMA